MNKYLDGYHKFIEKYNMVGSNLLFLRNDGYLENVTSGYSNLETKEATTIKLIVAARSDSATTIKVDDVEYKIVSIKDCLAILS